MLWKNEICVYFAKLVISEVAWPISGNQDEKDISCSKPSLTETQVYTYCTSQKHCNPINSTARIIVKFVRRDARDKLYKAGRKLKNNSTRDPSLSRHSDKKIISLKV